MWSDFSSASARHFLLALGVGGRMCPSLLSLTLVPVELRRYESHPCLRHSESLCMCRRGYLKFALVNIGRNQGYLAYGPVG